MLAAEPAGPPAQGPSPAAQTPHRESVGFSIDAPEFSSDEFRIFSFKVGAWCTPIPAVAAAPPTPASPAPRTDLWSSCAADQAVPARQAP